MVHLIGNPSNKSHNSLNDNAVKNLGTIGRKMIGIQIIKRSTTFGIQWNMIKSNLVQKATTMAPRTKEN